MTPGVAIISIDHSFVWTDRSFAEIIGYEQASLHGRTFESITHADDLDLDHDLANRLFSGEIEKYEMEKRYIHANGDTVPIQLNVSLIRDHFGTVLYALAVVRKIAPTEILRVIASAPLTAKELEMDHICRAVLGA